VRSWAGGSSRAPTGDCGWCCYTAACWSPHCSPGRAVADAWRTASLPPRPRVSRGSADGNATRTSTCGDQAATRSGCAGFLAIIGRSLVIPDQLRSPLAQGGTGDPRDPPPPMGERASRRPADRSAVSQARHLGQAQPGLRGRLRGAQIASAAKGPHSVLSCVSNRARFVARPRDTEGAAQHRQNVGRAPRIWSHR
jgi:hypothetical protein